MNTPVSVARVLATFLMASAIALLAACSTAPAVEPGTRTTMATGLNGPMGVAVDPEGTLHVVDSGTGGETVVAEGITYGETSRLIRVGPTRQQTVVANLPSLGFEDGSAAGASRIAFLNGEIYVASGEFEAEAADVEPPFHTGVVRIEDGAAVGVGDTWAFETAENPDGVALFHTNPYDLAAGPDGDLLLTDAGGNALLSVDPDTGDVTLVEAFAMRTMPDPETGETMPLEPVPTGVAVGGDDAVYVSFFHGGVVRIPAEGDAETFSEEPLLLTDIALGPDDALYAVQISDETFSPTGGRLLRFADDGSFEVVLDGLAFPSSVAFDGRGNAYLTVNTLGAPGSGEVIRVARIDDL